jgi:hypothetical protein
MHEEEQKQLGNSLVGISYICELEELQHASRLTEIRGPVNADEIYGSLSNLEPSHLATRFIPNPMANYDNLPK